MSFLDELKRRHVVRVALLYVVAGLTVAWVGGVPPLLTVPVIRAVVASVGLWTGSTVSSSPLPLPPSGTSTTSICMA